MCTWWWRQFQAQGAAIEKKHSHQRKQAVDGIGPLEVGAGPWRF